MKLGCNQPMMTELIGFDCFLISVHQLMLMRCYLRFGHVIEGAQLNILVVCYHENNIGSLDLLSSSSAAAAACPYSSPAGASLEASRRLFFVVERWLGRHFLRLFLGQLPRYGRLSVQTGPKTFLPSQTQHSKTWLKKETSRPAHRHTHNCGNSSIPALFQVLTRVELISTDPDRKHSFMSGTSRTDRDDSFGDYFECVPRVTGLLISLSARCPRISFSVTSHQSSRRPTNTNHVPKWILLTRNGPLSRNRADSNGQPTVGHSSTESEPKEIGGISFIRIYFKHKQANKGDFRFISAVRRKWKKHFGRFVWGMCGTFPIHFSSWRFWLIQFPEDESD